METVTDPNFDGWLAQDGSGIGDPCAFIVPCRAALICANVIPTFTTLHAAATSFCSVLGRFRIVTQAATVATSETSVTAIESRIFETCFILAPSAIAIVWPRLAPSE